MKKTVKKLLIILSALIVIAGITLGVLIINANKLLREGILKVLGEGFSIERVELNLGGVDLYGVLYTRPDGVKSLSFKHLKLNADFRAALKKQYIVSEVVLEEPYLLLETGRDGKFLNPLGRPEKEKEEKEQATPVNIGKIKIINGSIDYMDNKAGVKTPLREIALEAEGIDYPFPEALIPYTLSLKIPSGESAADLKGKGSLSLKTFDHKGSFSLRGLDITQFKPYFQKKGDVNVTRGFLNLDMSVDISSKRIKAPGNAVIKNLEFESGQSLGRKFMGVPLSLVVSFLKDNRDEIAFEFMLEGDLSNPKFSLRESFVQRFTIGLAEKLGLSLKGTVQSVIELGAEGVKEVGKGLKGIVNSIFK